MSSCRVKERRLTRSPPWSFESHTAPIRSLWAHHDVHTHIPCQPFPTDASHYCSRKIRRVCTMPTNPWATEYRLASCLFFECHTAPIRHSWAHHNVQCAFEFWNACPMKQKSQLPANPVFGSNTGQYLCAIWAWAWSKKPSKLPSFQPFPTTPSACVRGEPEA